ncbi:hypothetical protein PO909_020044, partial [Leuciscus waleckii]
FPSCQVFSIVVFASITAEGYVNSPYEADVKCVFNGNDGVCRYGVGIGVIAFLACIAFLLADALLPSMSSAQERKYVVLADLGFSGAWTFLWFVCFCLTADQWTKTINTTGIPKDAAQAVIAFSFFSLASWVSVCVCVCVCVCSSGVWSDRVCVCVCVYLYNYLCEDQFEC